MSVFDDYKKSTSKTIEEEEEEEECDNELLSKLQSSEIDIDEFVTRSIRKTDNTRVSKSEGVADVYTVNSKLLPSLTEHFQPDIPPEIKIPDFTKSTPEQAVESLGALTGITDYEVNLISFWTLDTLAGCIQNVQKNRMEARNQKVLIAWFGFFLKTLSVHGWNREDTFSDFKKLIFTANSMMRKGSAEIPLPVQCLNNLQNTHSLISARSRLSEPILTSGSNAKLNSPKRRSSSKSDKTKSSTSIRSKSGLSNENLTKNLNDLKVIADLVYEIFANRFKFEVIKTAFTSASNTTTVHLPHPLSTPKCLEPPEDVGLKKGKDKKEKEEKSKKGKKSPSPKEEINIEPIPSNQYILPLAKAVEVNKIFFEQIFPQSPAASTKKLPKPKGKNKK